VAKRETKKPKNSLKKRRNKKPVILESTNVTTDVTVRHGDHRLSQFVVNLQGQLPSPQKILEDDAQIRLNLLDQSLARTIPSFIPPKNTLTLEKTDIISQLNENFETRKPKRFVLQRLPRNFSAIQQAHGLRMTINLPQQKSISINEFLPKPVPEDIFSYFDLPKTEEPEESDLVELDEKRGLKPAASSSSSSTYWSFPSFLRPVGAFILISFIFVLPLHAMNLITNLRQTKSEVETVSKEAFSYLQTGTHAAAQKEKEAGSAFSRASDRFSQAQQTISKLGIGASVVLSAIPNAQKNLSTAKDLLSAGEHLSTAGSRAAEAMDALDREISPTPISRLRILQSYLRSIIPHLSYANNLLTDIKPQRLPEAERNTFLSVQNRLPALIASLSEFDNLSELTTHILGADATKRYLLIFQNNAEIRPTGGFMGSFAEVKVRDGVLEQMLIPGGGTYDLQGLLKQSRAAPAPLQLLNARWEFQDANWFPDFPTSARQILEFYQDAGGPSVDGVIAINATYVADLIGLLGPIEMDAYERTIDAENFLFEAQKIVELEYNREINKPKQFIGELAPKLVQRALEGKPEQFLTLIDHLSNGLAQKDIQLYFADEALQRPILEHGWGGAIIQTPQDYLMAVNTNLGGGKTDAVIEEKMDVRVSIESDGSIVNTVTLSRTHHGIPGVIFTGVNNVDYVRLYVPKGSELLRASGFDIPDDRLFETPSEEWLADPDLEYAALTQTVHEESATDVYEENGKTVFGNWVQTPPGSTSKVEFIYRLPLNALDGKKQWLNKTSPYSLTIQKQPGILDRTTTVSVSLPENIKQIWQSSSDPVAIFDNSMDGFFGLLLEPR
jgi:hypothetical protein